MKAQTFAEHQKRRIQKQCQKKSVFQRPRSKSWDQKHGLYQGDVMSSQHDWCYLSSVLFVFILGIWPLAFYAIFHAYFSQSLNILMFLTSTLLFLLSIWLCISSHLSFHGKRLSPCLYAKFEHILNQNPEYTTWLMPFVANTGPIRARTLALLSWIDESMGKAKKKDETLYKVVQELHWAMPGEMSEKALQHYFKRCIKEARKRDKNEAYRLKQMELEKAWNELQKTEEKSQFEQHRRVFEEKKNLSDLPVSISPAIHAKRL